ncbi:MAG TPA: hypothetical protein DC014_00680 [Treponema sp.]|nr:hypothetical protein [Treponema sp.]
MKKSFLAVCALSLAAFVLVGCATTESAGKSGSGNSFAGKSYQQIVKYADGSKLEYNFDFGTDNTYTLSAKSEGVVTEKLTYKYAYNASEGTMTAQLISQWLPKDPVDLLTASTAEDYAQMERVPLNKKQVKEMYVQLVEILADYYTSVGTPLTQYQQKQILESYNATADYLFDTKVLYTVEVSDTSLQLKQDFTKLTDGKLQFYTPSAASNPSLTSIYLITGYMMQITFNGTEYYAQLTDGHKPVFDTSKKTLTAYLNFTDPRDGTVYEFGDLVCSYKTEGTGNDTVLILTVTSAPSGLKDLEGAVARLSYIRDGFNLRLK